jgi:hypothetical protein
MRLSLSAMRRQARVWAVIAVYAAMAAVVIGASALVLAGHIHPRVRDDAPASTRGAGGLPLMQTDILI